LVFLVHEKSLKSFQTSKQQQQQQQAQVFGFNSFVKVAQIQFSVIIFSSQKIKGKKSKA